MIGAVHARPHQVGHGRVDAHVIAIRLLAMGNLSHKVTVWSCDTATVFHHDPKFWDAFVNDFLLIQLAQPISEILPRERCLIRLIGNAHSTAQVDEFQSDALISVKFGSDIE